MNKSQSNYFNMAKAVRSFFNDSQAWRGMPLIEQGVAKISSLCDGISEEAANQYKNQTAGYTSSKEHERKGLENMLYLVATRIKVYAQRNNDLELAAEVGFSRSKLKGLTLNNLILTARTVTDSASLIVEQLEQYNVSQIDIDNMYSSIEKTAELAARRDTVRSERTENTAHLAMLFGELRNELKLMDTQVEAFVADESFVRTYFFVRRVNDLRGGNAKKSSEEGKTPVGMQ